MTNIDKLKKYYNSMSVNSLIGHFILIPIVLGLLLSDVFGIDVSGFIKQYFGLFRAVEGIGKDIQTKSMIFFIALILAPFFLISLNNKRVENPQANKNKQKLGVPQLIFLVTIGFPMMLMASIGALIIEINLPESGRPLSPATRFLRACAESDILFGLFSIFVLLMFVLTLFAIFFSAKDLYLRFIQVIKKLISKFS